MANDRGRSAEEEISAGERFQFGENWKQFLELLNEDRITQAEGSLVKMLGPLSGKSVLDIGSGSGLLSLAARRLGAKVMSFDYDPRSVWCTEHVRERFFPGDSNWQVSLGSVLDDGFMKRLPEHDIVYSWGVLHHTGHMTRAIENAAARVRSRGLLYLALYRKTWLCPLWKAEKRLYCASPAWIQRSIRSAYMATVGAAWRLKNGGSQLTRGMDEERDVHDWLGGYPYESITPRALKSLLAANGFTIRAQVSKSEGIHIVPGCDEFVFQRA